MWRHKFIECMAKRFIVCNHDHITSLLIGPTYCQCKLERLINFKIPLFFDNFCGYKANLIVYEFEKQHDREIIAIGQNIKQYL